MEKEIRDLGYVNEINKIRFSYSAVSQFITVSSYLKCEVYVKRRYCEFTSQAQAVALIS